MTLARDVLEAPSLSPPRLPWSTAQAEPCNTELQQQMRKAQAEAEEDAKERQLGKAAAEGQDGGPSLEVLKRLERLVQAVKATAESTEGPRGLGAGGLPPAGRTMLGAQVRERQGHRFFALVVKC